MSPEPLAPWTLAQALASSLAAGLLVGLERGWRDRELADGGRVAGLRTFGLVGLLGGVLGSLADPLGAWPIAAGLLALALLLAVSYGQAVQASHSLSITTAVACLLTLVLGVLAARGQPVLAIGAAVVTAVLLDMKSTLHRWLQLIEHRELTAGLQMLVLSAVVLPLLPDQGYGPYAALNPWRLWWAVVLIAGLSLAGHVAIRLTGPRRGVFWTGVLGGLASSTAASLTLARAARAQPALTEAAAGGALASCAVMFLRMTVLVAVLRPTLLPVLAPPWLAACATLLALSLHRGRHRTPAHTQQVAEAAPAPTFDLTGAFGFGAFLALMMVLVRAAHAWLGTEGVYTLAALSGLLDVDAPLISTLRLQHDGGLSATGTAVALGLAIGTNMVTKAVMVHVTAGRRMGRRVASGYAAAMVVCAIVMLLLNVF